MADHNDSQAKGTTSSANDGIANHKTNNKESKSNTKATKVMYRIFKCFPFFTVNAMPRRDDFTIEIQSVFSSFYTNVN